MQPHRLTNFKIKFYENKSRFNGIYSRNDLPKTKDGAYVINLDEFKSIETHRRTSYVNGNNGSAIYFNNFEVENIPKEI